MDTKYRKYAVSFGGIETFIFATSLGWACTYAHNGYIALCTQYKPHIRLAK